MRIQSEQESRPMQWSRGDKLEMKSKNQISKITHPNKLQVTIKKQLISECIYFIAKN